MDVKVLAYTVEEQEISKIKQLLEYANNLDSETVGKELIE